MNTKFSFWLRCFTVASLIVAVMNVNPSAIAGNTAAPASTTSSASNHMMGSEGNSSMMGSNMNSASTMAPNAMGTQTMGPGMRGPNQMGSAMGSSAMGTGMMGEGGWNMMGSGMMGFGMMNPGMMSLCGQGMMGSYGFGPGMMLGHFMSGNIELSSSQREQMADIWNHMMSDAWPILGELRQQYYDLSRLFYAEHPDRAAIDRTYAKISALQKKLLDIHLQTHQKFESLLTAQQRKQLQ